VSLPVQLNKNSIYLIIAS